MRNFAETFCDADFLRALKNTSFLIFWALRSGFPYRSFKLTYDGPERMNYSSNADMYALVTAGESYGSDEKDLKAQTVTYAPEGFESLIEDSYKYYKDTEKYQQTDYLFSASIASVAEYKATLLSKW